MGDLKGMYHRPMSDLILIEAILQGAFSKWAFVDLKCGYFSTQMLKIKSRSTTSRTVGNG